MSIPPGAFTAAKRGGKIFSCIDQLILQLTLKQMFQLSVVLYVYLLQAFEMTNKVTCSEKSDTESNSRTKRIEEKMSNDSNGKILKTVEHH